MSSIHANRATMSLLNMCNEMYRKGIEINRITKTCELMILAGLSCRDVRSDIVDRCVSAQQADGGFIGNTDTLWNAKLLSNYPEYHTNYLHAVQWLRDGNGVEPGWGRSKRDIHRIPVTGMVLYLLPELAQKATLEWLERTWLSERNSLTYKAAYTLLAFQKCGYKPRYMQELATDTADWLASQQQINGGFAPWRGHPVGENVYCTALAVLALTSLEDKSYYKNVKNAYNYLCYTQLRSGVWPYHEIEDGAAWGLFALTQAELFLEQWK